ncbi:uncharacterized protein AMSG_07748 [Thecamonas trahens ATCC 50062]|uniref:Uncharacterized protein n=1 Tax=Thecamonas trahens ATCC 50062 TaxID=461836 RepID=A0A0L0DH61_THETB|nr:hypothetical protein AMSG_07748 [Thecamonas trahens ATCC 50062]KNC51684.1 hypothetical protein AMSG_07748 [Thecamonas trahens ATCC 50062]|eukprot:XP_013755815.1 hypothetical protein AMSG_07748 [Thecamonas trahens ATCC 50062]
MASRPLLCSGMWLFLLCCLVALLATAALGQSLPDDAVVLLDVDILAPEAELAGEYRVFAHSSYEIQVVAYVREGGTDKFCDGSGCAIDLGFSVPLGTVSYVAVTSSIVSRQTVTFDTPGYYTLNVSATYIDTGAGSINEDDHALSYRLLDKPIHAVAQPVASLSFPLATSVTAATPFATLVSFTASDDNTTFHSVALSPAAHLASSIGSEILNERIDVIAAAWPVVFVNEHLVASAATTYSLIHTTTSSLGGTNTTIYPSAITVYPAPAIASALVPPSGSSRTTASTLALPLQVYIDPATGVPPYTYSVSIWSADGSAELLPNVVADVVSPASRSDSAYNASFPLPVSAFAAVTLPHDVVARVTLVDAAGAPATSVGQSLPITVVPPATVIGSVTPLVPSPALLTAGATIAVSVDRDPAHPLAGSDPFTASWDIVRLSDGAVFSLAAATTASPLNITLDPSILASPTDAAAFNITLSVVDSAGVTAVASVPGWSPTTVAPQPQAAIALPPSASAPVSVAHTGSITVDASVTHGIAPYAATISLRNPAAPTVPVFSYNVVLANSSVTKVTFALPDSIPPASDYRLALDAVDMLGVTASVINAAATVSVYSRPNATLALDAPGAVVTEGTSVALTVAPAAGAGIGAPYALVFSLLDANTLQVLSANLATATYASGTAPMDISIPLGASWPAPSLLTGLATVPASVRLGVVLTDASGAVSARIVTPASISLAAQLAAAIAPVNGVGATTATIPTAIAVEAVTGGVAPYIYAWSVGNSDSPPTMTPIVGNSPNISFTFDPSYLPAPGVSGTAAIRLLVTDATGASIVANASVTVAPSPHVSALALAPALFSATAPLTLSGSITAGVAPYSVSLRPYTREGVAIPLPDTLLAALTFELARGSAFSLTTTLNDTFIDVLAAAGVSTASDGGLELSFRATVVDAAGATAVIDGSGTNIDATAYRAPTVALQVPATPVPNRSNASLVGHSVVGGVPTGTWTFAFAVGDGTSLYGLFVTTTSNIPQPLASIAAPVPLAVPDAILADGVRLPATLTVTDPSGAIAVATAVLTVEPSVSETFAPASSSSPSGPDTTLIFIIVAARHPASCSLSDSTSGALEAAFDGTVDTVDTDGVLTNVTLHDLFKDVLNAVEDAEAYIEHRQSRTDDWSSASSCDPRYLAISDTGPASTIIDASVSSSTADSSFDQMWSASSSR